MSLLIQKQLPMMHEPPQQNSRFSFVKFETSLSSRSKLHTSKYYVINDFRFFVVDTSPVINATPVQNTGKAHAWSLVFKKIDPPPLDHVIFGRPLRGLVR